MQRLKAEHVTKLEEETKNGKKKLQDFEERAKAHEVAAAQKAKADTAGAVEAAVRSERAAAGERERRIGDDFQVQKDKSGKQIETLTQERDDARAQLATMKAHVFLFPLGSGKGESGGEVG